jgi:predicted dehydrogenase
MVINLMLHEFDFLTWLMGAPSKVIAYGIPFDSTHKNHVTSVLLYDDAYATVEGSAIMPTTFTFNMSARIVCEKGAIDFVPYVVQGEYKPTFVIYPDDGNEDLVTVEYSDEYQAVMAHVINVLRGQADNTIIHLDAAITSLQVALAAKESAEQEGKPVLLNEGVP